VVKSFGDRRALDGVDLELADGECLAVLGPNGAGKSTLLRTLATLLRPDAGELTVAGHALPAGARAVRGLVGYLGHDPLVYLDLTARQNLELFADLYGVPRPRERVLDLLQRVGLLVRAEETVRTFSRGMAQRLGLARLLLHRPRVLLLDEPYAGLDAEGEALLDVLLAESRGDRTVVVVTHDVERAIGLADQALVLRAGRPVLHEATPGLDAPEFRRRYEALVR
jgi:heme exporter protein A